MVKILVTTLRNSGLQELYRKTSGKTYSEAEVAPKKKEASTATISTTIFQMSFDSSNPSRRSSTRIPVPVSLTQERTNPQVRLDLLDDGGDEMDITLLHHPTTKPE